MPIIIELLVGDLADGRRRLDTANDNLCRMSAEARRFNCQLDGRFLPNSARK